MSGETEDTERTKRTGTESDGPGWNPASWFTGHKSLRTERLDSPVGKIQPQHPAPLLNEGAPCDQWVNRCLNETCHIVRLGERGEQLFKEIKTDH